MDDRQQVIQAHARLYADNGFALARYPIGVKKPPQKGWQTLNHAPESYQGNDNIGLIQGPASGNLCDIDCDSPHAASIAHHLFAGAPHYGRPGNPSSHWLLRCPDLPTKERTVDGVVRIKSEGSRNFQLNKQAAEALKLPLKLDRAMIVQLLSSGQSMAPPSLHPSGEAVAWEMTDAWTPPLEMAHAEAVKRAAALALCAVAAHAWPQVSGVRNEAAMALAGVLVRMGFDAETVDALTMAVAACGGDEEAEQRKAGESTHEAIKAGDAASGLPKLIELLGLELAEPDLRKWTGTERARSVGAQSAYGRDTDIEVTPDVSRFRRDLTRAITQLMPDTIFRRGAGLVRVRRLMRDEGDAESSIRFAGSVEIEPVNIDWLGDAFYAAGGSFWKLSALTGKPALVSPPDRALQRFIKVAGEHAFDELCGVSRTPTLRRDTPGYDPASCTFLAFDVGEFPPIPANPTRADAIEAAMRLFGSLSPFRLFPFASPQDRSVFATLLLCGIVRGELRTAPLVIADAPTPGSGKDMAIELVGLMLSGVLPGRITWSGGADEPEKRLASMLLAAAQCIQIANIDYPLGGSFLCDVLTSEVLNIRVLGESRAPAVPVRSLMMASGNNVRVSGDMTRRVLYCRLDAGVERPELRAELRDSGFDARAEMLKRRAELVAAALTILRAYDAAGRPKPDGHVSLGSFEQWDDLIRGAVLWLGAPDPIETQARGREGDEVRERNVAILGVLERVFGNREFQTRDLDGPDLNAIPARLEIGSTLPRQEWSRRLAGRRLAEIRDRPIGDLVLRGREDRNGVFLWRVERVR